jgi:hypothetical protein
MKTFYSDTYNKDASLIMPTLKYMQPACQCHSTTCEQELSFLFTVFLPVKYYDSLD